MATDLGKVGMRMRGAWSSSATYEVLDAVQYNNGTYIAKQAVPANTAPTNTTYWQSAIDSAIIGTTSIAGIGDGTLTGAVSMLNAAKIPKYTLSLAGGTTSGSITTLLPKGGVFLVATSRPVGATATQNALYVGSWYGGGTSTFIKLYGEDVTISGSGSTITITLSQNQYGAIIYVYQILLNP